MSGVSTLVDLLGGLPLALRSAGAYMNAVGISASQYLSLYDQQSKNLKTLMNKMPNLKDYDQDDLMTTWEISLSKVKEENADALKLLALCSYLDNVRIDRVFLILSATSNVLAMSSNYQ